MKKTKAVKKATKKAGARRVRARKKPVSKLATTLAKNVAMTYYSIGGANPVSAETSEQAFGTLRELLTYISALELHAPAGKRRGAQK